MRDTFPTGSGCCNHQELLQLLAEKRQDF